ncbi:bifunctional 2',3'-cyclic-nucleotide 2'-phosphodiesterase/3'-nucleotidase [Paracoccus kondratievae]|nr:bifunctional 2',3'-cyclic-nucleotide 2'-phosphodiesterase/3'-nucleotidase [Paracoccus kondratievae]
MTRHSPPPDPPPATGTISVRVMATTDLHMHLFGYDYLADRPSGKIGLSRVAALIWQARREAANCLLFDNGDSLQGNPLGDYLAETGTISPRHLHPAIETLNALQYDAATLGNHDFAFGTDFLRRVLEGASFPFVASNMRARRALPILPHLLLNRSFRDDLGRLHQLRIGVLGFLPPQTVAWEPALQSEITVEDILTAAQSGIAVLQQQGADLIVALAHSGIGALAPNPMMENAATALAAMPGIDVVIAGHTHRVFPSPDHPQGPGIDSVRGTLAGKPAVMPGFWGSHLGLIDLRLKRCDQGWHIADFTCHAQPVGPEDDHHSVTAPALSAHHQTLRHLHRRIGRTSQPLSSYFALIGEDPGLRLVTMAQRWHVRRALAGTPWQDLPILSAAAPFRAGGRGGPQHYTDVPAGQLTLRSIADLYLFPNRICALRLTGAELIDWLERSASLFLQVQPGLPDQPLIDPDFPSYNFDVVDGLDWQIDLSQPPRYAPDGRLAHPDSQRISGLRHRGQPVAPDQPFILATNSFRLSDCGLFAGVAAGRPVLLDSGARTREVLRRYVALQKVLTLDPQNGWSFRALPGTSVLFETGPAAAQHLDGLSRQVEIVGLGPDGFLQLRLHL